MRTNPSLLRLVICAAAFSLLACSEKPATDTRWADSPAAAAQASKARNQGIRWFDGTVEEAFNHAKESNKPVFLYWGAAWCPPCHELKATVFQQEAFIQASHHYVAVYLDGDDPYAQRQAEHFKVMGYPTLVVLNNEGKEISRIPNGLDLSVYADILHNTLQQLQPIDELLASLGSATPLTPAECRRLASYSWSTHSDSLTEADLMPLLKASSEACPLALHAERTLLTVSYLYQLGSQELTVDQAVSQSRKERLIEALSTQAMGAYRSTLYRMAPGSLFAFANEEDRAELSAAWLRQMRKSLATEKDVFENLQTLRAIRALQETPLDADLKQVLELAEQARATPAEDPRRLSLVNAAGNALREYEQLEDAKKLLNAEIKTSKYAWYFMSELAHIESLLGNDEQALQWLQKAWDVARGPASRFQWGSNYLAARLSLAPESYPRIEADFSRLLGELVANRVFYQRSAVRLTRLNSAFKEWASLLDNRMRIAKLRQQVENACASLDEGERTQLLCEEFLNFPKEG